MKFRYNILPALAIMIAGLSGVYMVYGNYAEDQGRALSSVEPAAGDETPLPVKADTTLKIETHTQSQPPVASAPAPVTAPVSASSDSAVHFSSGDAHLSADKPLSTDAPADRPLVDADGEE